MQQFEYYTPMDVASLFRTSRDMGQFIEDMIDTLSELKDRNAGDDSYIPPVVYSHQGWSFNFDYNFIVSCLSAWVNDSAVEGDFRLVDSANESVIKNGIFLVGAIFEDYYGVARINNRIVDLKRYRHLKTLDMKTRFYNLIVIKNGENYKRFSAVHFSASEVKNLIDANAYSMLVSIADNSKYEQVVFGYPAFKEFVKTQRINPEPVFG